MKNKIKKCFKLGILLFGISLTLVNCQKDDTPQIKNENQKQDNLVKRATKQGKDLPHIVNYLKRETQGRLKISIGENKISKTISNDAFSREVSSLGVINTTEVLEVADETTSTTKYTFSVISKDPDTFTNLIVVETPDEIKSYFIKYVPTNEWLTFTSGALDTFTGTIEIYSYEGDLINVYSLTNGMVTSSTTGGNPCFPNGNYGTGSDDDSTDTDTNTDTNDDTSGGNPGGEGGPSDPYSDDDNGGGLNYDPWGNWLDGWTGGGSGAGTDDISNDCGGGYCVVCDNNNVGVGNCSCEVCHNTWGWRYASITLETETTTSSTDLEMPYDYSDCVDMGVIKFLTRHLNLTDAQFDWLTTDPNIPTMVAIINFIEDNKNEDYTVPVEVSDFAQQAINFMMSNPNVSFSEYENWFSTGYPELEPIPLNINPDDITYDVPVIQEELPSFSNYISAYPKNGTAPNYTKMSSEKVYEMAGGSLWISHQSGSASYKNACSIRGSRGLLYSGINIPVLHYNGTQRTQKGGDFKNYILDAVSFDKFMGDKFGTATHELTGTAANDPQQVAQLLEGKTGIYVIINNNSTTANYSGHVDTIINGECIGAAWTTPNGGVKSIRIWVLN